MISNPERFQNAIAGFDEANSTDPTRIEYQGILVPAELLYAQQMTHWLKRLYPDASESLQLAVRAQHIRRWEIPRSKYPMDKAGYHQWRTRLYTFHADEAEKILSKAGYTGATISRVRSLIHKERLKADPETQALEDTICLTFLENYFADFAPKHDKNKIVGILKRTWSKMSPVGHQAALKLELPAAARRLIERALS